MDNNEEQKSKSARERAKERIDSARSKYNNAKSAARAGRTAGRLTAQAGKTGGRIAAQVGAQAARAAAQLAIQAAAVVAQAAAAATAAAASAVAAAAVPIGAIILGVVLIILIIVTGFVFFFVGTPPPTVAGEPPPAVCSGACQTTACIAPSVEDTTATCDKSASGETQVCCVPPLVPIDICGLSCDDLDINPAICLKQNFNVIVNNGTNQQKIDVYKILAYASKSCEYKRLLMKGGETLTIRMNDYGVETCAGYTPTENLIRLGPCSISYNARKYLLIHESGHIIKDRNPGLYQRYPLTTLRTQDARCYSPDGFLISYPLRVSCSYSTTAYTKRSEDFAESIADYSNYMSYNPTGTYCAVALTRFPTQCPQTYNWFNINIFAGYEY